MINGARISRRPAWHNAGLDISLFALCSARPGGPGNEGGRAAQLVCSHSRDWTAGVGKLWIIDMSGKLDQWEGSWVT